MNQLGCTPEEDIIPLWATLLRASQSIEARLEAALGDCGLSLSKLGVLNQLVLARDPIPLSRIAEKLACVKSNMTQLVDKLESDGLVARISDPKDRRCIRAAITPEGKRRFELGKQALVEQERLLLKNLECHEHELLTNLLGRI